MRKSLIAMVSVLFADDAPFIRKKITRLLREEGYEVSEAENGKVAVEKYRETKPDVVIMDITMPELDGISACRTILAGDPNAVIIMLSSMGQESTIQEALRAGARDFMVKPFDIKTANSKIRQCLSQSEA